MRETLLITMNSELAVMQTTLTNLQVTKNQAYGKVAANPSQAKYLLSVERLQRVKEQLYMFLLQKREENELSQAFTAYNTRVFFCKRFLYCRMVRQIFQGASRASSFFG